MKIAILGSSLPALTSANRLSALGASISLFTNGIKDLSLQEELSQEVLIETGKVLRVQKAFLSPNENIPNRSRLLDLFRVVYEVNPELQISEENERYQEILERLPKEVTEALKNTIELYQDFDCVIDARTPSEGNTFLGAGVFAIGEQNIRRQHPQFFYSEEKIDLSQLAEVKKGILLGFGAEAVRFLLGWEELNYPFSLDWIISEKLSEENLAKVKGLIEKIALKNTEEFAVFENKLNDWRELDDFIKVKIPCPVPPVSRLNIFLNHSVVAVQKLTDQNGIFLSIEQATFRETQPELIINTMTSEKVATTLRADKVFSYQYDFPFTKTFQGMRHPLIRDSLLPEENSEPGLFVLGNLQKGPAHYTVEQALDDIERIMTTLLRYFSPK